MTPPSSRPSDAEEDLRKIATELEAWLREHTRIGFGEEPRVDLARRALLERIGDRQ